MKKHILYAARKIVLFIITMWVVATLTFVLMHCLPGEPFISGKVIPPQILDNLNAKYGLDKPLAEQYIIYMGNLAKGDLGVSMIYNNKSVASIVKRAFPVSLELGIRAGITAVFVGLILGMFAAYYKYKTIDRLILVLSLIGVSIPGFVLGTVFQYFICYRLSDFLKNLTGSDLNMFPVTGWESFRYTVVPSLALALGAMGMIIRMMRASMIDVLGRNYITAARARGLSEREILFKHSLKNAVLPVLSVLGPLITSIIMGSFVIENIFSVPGLGQYFVSSVKAKDYTMVLGLSVFTAFIVVLVNTFTDILYSFIDPRIRIRE